MRHLDNRSSETSNISSSIILLVHGIILKFTLKFLTLAWPMIPLKLSLMYFHRLFMVTYAVHVFVIACLFQYIMLEFLFWYWNNVYEGLWYQYVLLVTVGSIEILSFFPMVWYFISAIRILHYIPDYCRKFGYVLD
jgi:hypothetical protein